MSYRLNLELIVTQPVLLAVKNYDINLPEICITSILNEIDRLNSITGAVAQTTASRDTEIRELKEALQFMNDKLEKAEAALAAQKQWKWHR
jgi:ribosomal protein L14E/L6E/L27E